MKCVRISQNISLAYRNVIQRTRTLPILSHGGSKQLQAAILRNTHLTSSIWRSPGHHRLLHGSSVSLANLISSDFIVHGPYPETAIPENLTVHDMIFKSCDEHKDTVAVEEFVTGRKYTYGELKENIIKLANGLYNLGLRKNDKVLAYTTNTVDFTMLMLACSCIGVWFSAANPMYTPADLARHIEHSESKALFVAEDLMGMANEAFEGKPSLRDQVKHCYVLGNASDNFKAFSSLFENDSTTLPEVPIDPREDVHVLPYSSGTTGFPKGVMLTHHNVVSNIIQCMPFTPTEHKSVLALLPFYHIYGMVVIQYVVLNAGGTLVVLPRFDPFSFLQCMQDRKIQVAYLVPPLIVFLTKHPMVAQYDLSSLERCFCGAASLGEDITNEFLNRLGKHIEIQQGYGLTETSPVACFDNEFHPGSIGYMLPQTEGKILDLETSKTLGPEKDGELCVKGPQVMKGYFKNEEATKDMIDSDGWLHTGDIGYYKENGVFYIKDRLKELIKYKGFQVPPAELESLLLSHPEIAEAGVIGVPDEKAGELPKAFVVLQEESQLTEEDIIKFVDDNVSDIKRLRGGVQIVYDIPKLPSGKILRRALKEM